jgi:PAS domain S-box-containing protein
LSDNNNGIILTRLLSFFLLALCLSKSAIAAAASNDWLAAHRAWRVGVVLAPPYAQLNPHGGWLEGADVAFMALLARQNGLQLSWHVYPDTAALDAAARHGEIDVSPGMAQTPASLRSWLFSLPYVRVPHKIVGIRADNADVVELDRLGLNASLAIDEHGDAWDFIVRNYAELTRVPVASDRLALKAVQQQAANYAIVDEAQLATLLREPSFADLAVVGDIGATRLLRLAVRRDWPQLPPLLDERLQQLPAEQMEQISAAWLRPSYPRLLDSISFWQRLTLAAVLAALAAGWFWQREMRTRHQLERRLLQTRQELAARHAAEASLRLTQFSIDHSTVGVLWVSWDSRIRYANSAVQRLLGYADGELDGSRLTELEPLISDRDWLATWNRLRAGDAGRSHETRCRRRDDSLQPVEVTLSFLQFDGNEYLVVYLTDISERLKARTRLRSLSAHLESVREEEKARIAREVHDELGQILTVLRLETSMCEIGFADRDPKFAERLATMKRLIESTFQIVRDVATALRPPVLDAGIASAIEWQARRFESRSGLTCLVSVPDAPLELDDGRATGLFRILQEALTNVLRHADASTVTVGLSCSDGTICMSVADDGKGFDPSRQPAERSFGLVGIRERVLLLGGEVDLDSQPGQGTTLVVRLPQTRTEETA